MFTLYFTNNISQFTQIIITHYITFINTKYINIIQQLYKFILKYQILFTDQILIQKAKKYQIFFYFLSIITMLQQSNQTLYQTFMENFTQNISKNGAMIITT
ncbi:hypothetical protein PPERSA_08334 [Pseudocohnilembus persalinus]|uniref:Uncharacterized protein n=1 Tax=Pseudocohnilembus persalinus TaxID=266149 RepID=A0A0V0QPW5_PSEPJ|nr:hypothetical protein PPERSA_08334 [Pseudocohnilembus persalinus]|eukprot:KRX04119.1 hypothetical protein PPERSA_08334 [Pseudocohnilembus persalinus]